MYQRSGSPTLLWCKTGPKSDGGMSWAQQSLHRKRQRQCWPPRPPDDRRWWQRRRPMGFVITESHSQESGTQVEDAQIAEPPFFITKNEEEALRVSAGLLRGLCKTRRRALR